MLVIPLFPALNESSKILNLYSVILPAGHSQNCNFESTGYREKVLYSQNLTQFLKENKYKYEKDFCLLFVSQFRHYLLRRANSFPFSASVEEQIMSMDKYPSIFSKSNGDDLQPFDANG